MMPWSRLRAGLLAFGALACAVAVPACETSGGPTCAQLDCRSGPDQSSAGLPLCRATAYHCHRRAASDLEARQGPGSGNIAGANAQAGTAAIPSGGAVGAAGGATGGNAGNAAATGGSAGSVAAGGVPPAGGENGVGAGGEAGDAPGHGGEGGAHR